MANRRDFVKGAAAAAFFSRTVLGANDRINYAFIGLGGRTGLLDAAWMKQPDGNLVAVCDCNKAKIDAYQKLKLADKKVDTFGDYRRVLDRKDIDAVLVAVPDHNHAPIMIAALEAGKDVYMEKPCSNTVEAAVAMLKAYRAHKQVVQLGTQQRSWDHFQEVARLVRDGALGPVNQILVGLSGGGGGGFGRARGPQAAPSAPPPIPEGLDWNAFLGPAKQVLYDPARLGWRGWYDYGGGLITDWGVHWLDIVHLAMGADTSGPSSAAAVSAYPGEENPNLERVPGSWIIQYKYPKFLLTMTSYTPPTPEQINEGPTFIGSRGFIRVNRNGYIIRSNRNNAPMPVVNPGGGRATQAMGVPGGAPGAMPGGRAGAATPGRAAQSQLPPIEEKSYVLTYEDNVAHERASEVVHVRNFFDCIKSRQKPTAEFEIGFHSTLPCLLGRQAVKDGKALIWDETTLSARPA
jgi:predicted dehydrogenase